MGGKQIGAIALLEKSREFRKHMANSKIRATFVLNLQVLALAKQSNVSAICLQASVDLGQMTRIIRGKSSGTLSYLRAAAVAEALGVSLESMLTKNFKDAIWDAVILLDKKQLKNQ